MFKIIMFKILFVWWKYLQWMFIKVMIKFVLIASTTCFMSNHGWYKPRIDCIEINVVKCMKNDLITKICMNNRIFVEQISSFALLSIDILSLFDFPVVFRVWFSIIFRLLIMLITYWNFQGILYSSLFLF